MRVTCDGRPVYIFSGDSCPGQSRGEKVSGFGGTWYLVRASASSNSGIPAKKQARRDYDDDHHHHDDDHHRSGRQHDDHGARRR